MINILSKPPFVVQQIVISPWHDKSVNHFSIPIVCHKVILINDIFKIFCLNWLNKVFNESENKVILIETDDERPQTTNLYKQHV